MPTTLTPLRYPGGKTKYADLFVEIVAMNNLRNCTFVEVFAGGAGAAVSLLLKGHVKAIILNDLDSAIYAFWRCVKEHPEDLIRRIRSTRVSMAEWQRQKDIYSQKDINDVLALGFATFFLNRCNHSGILGARPIGGLHQEGLYNMKSRFNKLTSIKKLEALAACQDALEVHNLDGLQFIQLLKTKYRNRKTLTYFDPPYYQKGPALYLNHLQHNDHEDLRDRILEYNAPWILSYDNNPTIREMYHGRDCNLYLNRLRHTINGNAVAEELVISRLQLPLSLERINNTKAGVDR